MNCPEARKLVHLFVDGALDARANVDVLAHLNMCPSCNERFVDAKKFEDFLKERLKPGMAPEALKGRICACLAEMSAPWPVRVAGSLRRRPLVSMAGVAALVAISFASLYGYGHFSTCPYVIDATKRMHDIATGTVRPLPQEGPSRRMARDIPPPVVAGYKVNGEFGVDMGPRFQDAIAYRYRMDHCADDATCTVLFFVNAPGLVLGEHNCVVRGGRKFCTWEYDGCRVVCWKDEKRGLYALMVCEKREMEHEALVNFASVASSQ